jgi:enoyl-CoA hydratase/carnithine racemase
VEFDTLEVTVDGSVATLLLNRPEKLNPLSAHTLYELEAAARWLDGHGDLKVVVVSGRGRAFSSGADVGAFSSGADVGAFGGGPRSPSATPGGPAADSPEAGGATSRPAPTREDRDQGWRMCRALEELRAVTVARVQGWCVGGGVVLVAACDLRVAAADARFSIPEVELGIPLAWGGIPRLVREIGPALTKELVMTCRVFGAAEARAAGFLNDVVDPDQLDDAVDRLVERLVAMPRQALLATKAHTNAVAEAMVGTGRSWADADVLVSAFADAEGRESARRYLERMRAR